ncbi:MAG: cation diffusion facilitator family transporter [Nitrospirae bacterium]|nr:cation diffusion facilitator family transporter [Nitrospirota bacterium]
MGSDTLKKDYSENVRYVLILTLILNFGVALAKVLYGLFTNSIAITSDGFHSSFDGVSNIVGLIGIWIASHPPDEKHPYGHKKYETLFTILIAIMIFATCFQILRKVYLSFLEDHTTIVTETSFIIMFFTMGINVFVMLYESRKGKQLGSQFLVADALHTKSDIFVSIAVIISLIFTRIGYSRADVIVGIIITFFIARIGYKIIKEASDILVDTVCMDNSAIEFVVNSIEGVKGCHDIRTRGSVHSVYLDLHALVGRGLTTEKAHEIADRIETEIKKEFPSVVDIIVHIEPASSEH